MAKASDFLTALFHDIYCEGAVVIDKRKLLALMGKGQDRPSAWEHLLDLWDEAGYDRDSLNGAEHGGNVVLTFGLEFVEVEKWASS